MFGKSDPIGSYLVVVGIVGLLWCGGRLWFGSRTSTNMASIAWQAVASFIVLIVGLYWT